MKFLIAFSCLLAVASAGYINANAGYINAPLAYAASDDGAYRGEGLYESAYKGEGILEANSLGYAYNTPLAYAGHYAAPVVASGSHAVAYNAPLVSAPHPVPVHHAYAAPIAHTYAAHTYGAPIAHSVAPYAHAYSASVGHAYAAPVAHAYAAHAYAAPIAHAYAAPTVALASEARLVDPVAIAAGAPLPGGDTVEVAAAKAFHHAAHHEAKKTHLLAKTGHIIAKRSPLFLGAPLAYSAPVHSYGYSSYASPLAYNAGYGYGYGRLGAFYG